MDLPFQLQSVVEDAAYEGGATVPTIRTTYKLGNFGPFTVTLRKTEYSADAVKAEADKMRAQLSSLS